MNGEKMTAEKFVKLEWGAKLRVLRDHACSEDVIRVGVGDKFWRVRTAAVGNPSAPVDVIRAGVRDADVTVRMLAVGHPGAPEDVIRAGGKDEAECVRAAAVGNPSAPEDVIWRGVVDEHPWVRAGAVGNPSAPVDVLVVAAKRREKDLRVMVARHLRLSEDLAEKLSKSKVAAVQEALAGNPVVPEHIRVVARMKLEAGRR